MDDTAQREKGGGYWRLEDLNEGHPTWPYRLDEVFEALAAGSGGKAAL